MSSGFTFNLSFWPKITLSVILAGLFLFLAFDRQDGQSLLASLEFLRIEGLVGYCLLFLLSHCLRIIRWGNLIKASHSVSWSSLFSIGAQGYALIVLLPFRMGEASRPIMLKKKHHIPVSTTLGTLLIERISDGLMCIVFFTLSLFLLVPSLPNSSTSSTQTALIVLKTGAWSLGTLFLLLSSGILLLLWRPSLWKSLIEKRVGPFFPSLAHSLIQVSDTLIQGLKFSPKQWGTFFALTFLYWSMQGCIFPLMAYATQIHPLSLSQSFVLLSIVVIGIMIPAGPGFTGSFELALKGGFILLMIPEHPHLTLFIGCLHLSQLVCQVGLGLGTWICNKSGESRLT